MNDNIARRLTISPWYLVLTLAAIGVIAVVVVGVLGNYIGDYMVQTVLSRP